MEQHEVGVNKCEEDQALFLSISLANPSSLSFFLSRTNKISLGEGGTAAPLGLFFSKESLSLQSIINMPPQFELQLSQFSTSWQLTHKTNASTFFMPNAQSSNTSILSENINK